MPSSPRASTEGSKIFEPDQLFTDLKLLTAIRAHLNKNDLCSAITEGFHLPLADNYIYHAAASVSLIQVQNAINAGSSHGLHDWYLDSSLKPNGHPPTPDIAAYISLFDPSKSPANTLKGFLSNAKKDSLRKAIADNLVSTRFIHSSVPVIPKRKAAHANPYIDFWSWACHSLEYAGPDANMVHLKMSHHVLPVFMHHFGCVCPSYEALSLIAILAKGKTVIDLGSGNGYWTYILRREHLCTVVAVDSGQSKWRTNWIDDTVVADGIRFLQKRQNTDEVLLMVYPIVSNQFTENAVRAFKGDIICIAATQNGSGYSGFKNERVDLWFAREMTGWDKIVQIPLPSFPGKDDALFVFRRVGRD